MNVLYVKKTWRLCEIVNRMFLNASNLLASLNSKLHILHDIYVCLFCIVHLICLVKKLKDSIDKECEICFEDLVAGDRVATLDCLCIYHEKCIVAWFNAQETKHGLKSCPVHI